MSLIIKPIPAEAVWPHRQKVMYPDLTVQDVILEHDQEGLHIGLFIEDLMVTCVSLFFENDGMQFRKLATLEEHQGKGYAIQMLQHAFNLAKERNCTRIWCNSRESACRLYEKFGMTKTPMSYTKHGINFVIMEVEI